MPHTEATSDNLEEMVITPFSLCTLEPRNGLRVQIGSLAMKLVRKSA